MIFQKMLACGKARGGLDIIGQSGNTQNDGVRGFFGAEPGAACHTALAKRARQSQNASEGANAVLLLRRKLGKGTVLRSGFAATMVTDRKTEELPIFVPPSRRNGKTKKQFGRGSSRRLPRIRVPHPL